MWREKNARLTLVSAATKKYKEQLLVNKRRCLYLHVQCVCIGLINNSLDPLLPPPSRSEVNRHQQVTGSNPKPHLSQDPMQSTSNNQLTVSFQSASTHSGFIPPGRTHCNQKDRTPGPCGFSTKNKNPHTSCRRGRSTAAAKTFFYCPRKLQRSLKSNCKQPHKTRRTESFLQELCGPLLSAVNSLEDYANQPDDVWKSDQGKCT